MSSEEKNISPEEQNISSQEEFVNSEGENTGSEEKKGSKHLVFVLILILAVIILGVVVLSKCFFDDGAADDLLSDSDIVSASETVSESDVSSETTTTTVDTRKNINEYIKDPNYESKYYMVVYTYSQSVVVYRKDSTGGYNKLHKRMTCSTGVHKVTPTREGLYTLNKKYRWIKLMGGVYGQYSCAISKDYLFHSVSYYEKDPSTLSDSAYDKLGGSASHGCIRLCVRDAKWIYDHIPIGTQVNVVWAEGPYGLGVPKRNTDEKYSGWDPTDKWSPGNPYFTDDTTNTTTGDTTGSTTSTDTSSSSTDVSDAATTSTQKDEATTTKSAEITKATESSSEASLTT